MPWALPPLSPRLWVGFFLALVLSLTTAGMLARPEAAIAFRVALGQGVQRILTVPQPPWLGALGWLSLAVFAAAHGLYLLKLQRQLRELAVKARYWRAIALDTMRLPAGRVPVGSAADPSARGRLGSVARPAGLGASSPQALAPRATAITERTLKR